jgi:hypothetical protein
MLRALKRPLTSPPTSPLTGIGLLVALLAIAPAAIAANAGVYRWFDDRGNLHYDDQNLLGERITRSTLNQREIAAEPALVIPPEFVEEVKLRCTDFSERAQSYRKAGEIYGRDPSGNSYQLSTQQAALARLDAERLKQRFCRNDAARKILLEERAARLAAAKAKAARSAQADKASHTRTQR